MLRKSVSVCGDGITEESVPEEASLGPPAPISTAAVPKATPIGADRAELAPPVRPEYASMRLSEIEALVRERTMRLRHDNFGEAKVGAVASLDKEMPS